MVGFVADSQDTCASWIRTLNLLGMKSERPQGMSESRAWQYWVAILIGLANRGCTQILPRLLSCPRDSSGFGWAVHGLASLGTPECIEPCLHALASKDDNVRGAMLHGLTQARHTRSPEFVDAMFEAIWTWRSQDPEHRWYTADKVLRSLDPNRAIDTIFSPAGITRDNWQHGRAWNVLCDFDPKKPLPVLQRLEAEFRPRDANDPVWSLYTEIGRLLLHGDTAKGLAILNEALDCHVRSAASDAAWHLMRFHNLDGVDDLVPENDQADETKQVLPRKIQRVFDDLMDAYDLIFCRSLGRLFADRHALFWRRIDTHLRAIGATASSAILTEMATLAGVADPTLTLEDLTNWRLPDAVALHDERLTALWNEDTDRRSVLLYRYMLARRDVLTRENDL